MHRHVLAGNRGLRLLALAALAACSIALAALPAPASAAAGWDLVLDRPSPNFGGIDFVSPNEGWLVAGAGLLHSTNGGASWQEQARISANDVDFADALHGWAAGNDGAVFATTDGGATWRRQASGTAVHLLEVVALSPTEAVIVGAHAGYSDVITYPTPTALLRTTDGGASWQSVPLEETVALREIEFVGDEGWALGSVCPDPPEEGFYGCPASDVPLLLHTGDRGATWAPLDAEPPPRARMVDFVDAQNGWMVAGTEATVGFITGVFHTADGGLTWTQQLEAPDEVSSFEAPTFQDASTGWTVLTRYGVPRSTYEIRKTTNGGATWDTVSSLEPGRFQYLRNFSIEGSRLFISGGGGLALRSTDGGASWQTFQHPALSISSYDFADPAVGYALSGAALLRTADAGRSWSPVGTLPADATSVQFMDASHGLVAGGQCCEATFDYLVHVTEDGGRTWREVHRTRAFAGRTYVHDIAFAGQAGWIALDGGFLFTSDGGETWQERPLPDGIDYLIRADLADATHAWVIAQPAGAQHTRLYRTADAARTWQASSVEGEIQQVRFVDADHGWYTASVCDQTCVGTLYATSDGGDTWSAVSELPELSFPRDLYFFDRLNGWLNSVSCDENGCRSEVQHTADGGGTWVRQLAGEQLLGDFDFIDVRNGWFLLDPNRGQGIGGGPPQRTLLYHTTDGGGGPIGNEPPPKLPDSGQGAAPRADGALPLATLLALAALGLGAGALLARRR